MSLPAEKGIAFCHTLTGIAICIQHVATSAVDFVTIKYTYAPWLQNEEGMLPVNGLLENDKSSN